MKSHQVLNIMQCTNLGGMERSSLLQMRGLQSRGHEVRVLSLNPVGRLGPLLKEAGIASEGLEYRGRGGWRSHGALRARLRRVTPDFVVMTGHHFLTTLALRSVPARRKMLAMHYHHHGVKRPWTWRAFYALVANTFDVVTFPSDFVRQEAENLFPPLKRLSRTVRNPILVPPPVSETDRLSAREELGIPRRCQVVGNAGWLVGRKRFDVFLSVARQVAAANEEVVFVIAGGGPEEQKLRRMANDLGIESHVKWLGWLQDMDPFYRALDVMLFNSDWDAFPTTPLEAMAQGVPVVASVAVGGLSEAISSPATGVLVDEHDVEFLANSVIRLLQDDSGVGKAGRERVSNLCSATDRIAEFERVLVG